MPSTPPPATPGRWASVLGIFSTAKKKPPPSSVGSGTNDTRMENADLSRLTEEGFHQHDSVAKSDGLASTPGDNFMSPMSPNSLTGRQSASRRSNGARKSPKLDITALQHRTSTPQSQSRLQNGSLFTQNQLFGASERPALGNSTPRSPWQNRGGAFQKTTTNAATLAPSPWHGRRSHADAPNRSLVQFPATSNPRARNYRPNAVGLIGSRPGRRYRKAGEFNQERVSQALDHLKGSFLTTLPRDTSTSVYAVKGKVQYGSSSRASRLPPPTQRPQKRQRSEQLPQQKREYEEDEEEDYEEQSRKKRKKVSFNQDGDDDEDAAVVQKITATSFAATPGSRFKSAANRKGTPMPSKRPAENSEPSSAEAPSASSGGTETPSSSVTETLPEKPPGIDFVLGGPLEFTASVETFDPPMLDPTSKALAFDWTPKGPISKSATPSYQDGSEWASMRFEKPISPPKKPASSPGEHDDQEPQQQASKRTKKDYSADGDDIPDWQCSNCKKYNKHDESKCVDCGTGRGAGLKIEGWGNLFASLDENKWQCGGCLVKNDNKLTKCSSCETPRPGFEDTQAQEGPKTADNSPKVQSPGKASFPFPVQQAGAPGAAGSNSFQWGAPTGTLPLPSGQPQGGGESKFTFSAQSAAPATSTGSFSVFNIPAPKSDSKNEQSTTKTTNTPAPTGFIYKPGDSSESKALPTTFVVPPSSSKSDNVDATPAPAPSTSQNFPFDSAQAPKTNSQSNNWNVTSTTKTPAPAPLPEGTKPPDPRKEPTGTNSFSTDAFGMSADAKPFKPKGENGDNSTSGSKPFAVESFSKEDKAGENPSSSQGGFPYPSSTSAGLFGSSAPFGSSSAGPAKRARGYDLEETKTSSQTKAPAPFASSFEQEKKADSSNAQPIKFPFTSPAPATAAPAPGPSGDHSFVGSSAPAPNSGKGGDSNSAGLFAGNAQSGPTLFGAPASAPSGGAPPFSFGNAALGSSGAGVGSGLGASNDAPFSNSGGGSAAPSTGSKPSFQFPPSSQGAAAPAATPATSFGGGSTSQSSGGHGFPPNSNTAPAPPAQSFGANPSSSAQPGYFGSAATPGFNAPPPPAAAPTQGFGAPQQQPATTPASAGAGFGFPSSAGTPAAAMPPFGSTQAPLFGSAQAPAFGSAQAPSFGAAQPPAMAASGFGSTPGGASGFNNPAGFGSSTPGAAGGSMGGGFGTAGFPSQQTPAPAGGFGGGFNATPNTAPGTGFSIGTADPIKPKRRVVRAKRPTRN